MNPRTQELSEPAGPADHLRGPDEAVITLVEYGDFECPNCRQAAGAVKLLQARFEGRVRLAFRNYPLEQIHPHSLQAALAAECAGAQGKFWPMHDLLFENQERLQPGQILEYARTLGLDEQRFSAEMDNRAYLQQVRGHQRSGDASGVRATPTFFVNGRLQDVSFGLQSLFDAVEAELRAAGLRDQAASRRVLP